MRKKMCIRPLAKCFIIFSFGFRQ